MQPTELSQSRELHAACHVEFCGGLGWSWAVRILNRDRRCLISIRDRLRLTGWQLDGGWTAPEGVTPLPAGLREKDHEPERLRVATSCPVRVTVVSFWLVRLKYNW